MTHRLAWYERKSNIAGIETYEKKSTYHSFISTVDIFQVRVMDYFVINTKFRRRRSYTMVLIITLLRCAQFVTQDIALKFSSAIHSNEWGLYCVFACTRRQPRAIQDKYQNNKNKNKTIPPRRKTQRENIIATVTQPADDHVIRDSFLSLLKFDKSPTCGFHQY